MKQIRVGIVTVRIRTNRKYRLEISAKGFTKKILEIDDFRKFSAKSLTVILEIAPISEEVDVEQNSILDKQDLLTEEQLDTLPDDPESLKRVLLERFGLNSDVPFTVNGIPVTELPPRSQIKQIRFNRNIFSAKHAGVSGGGIEITTKSVAKGISGYLSFDIQNSKLNARNPFYTNKKPFRFSQVFAGVSFPLF